MKPIERGELYEHLSGFLKAKGIELKDGSYSKGIENGCGLLADAINLSQKGLTRAKVEMDKTLDQMRQAIHEKTAPKGQPTPAAEAPKPKATKPTAKTKTSGSAKRGPAKRQA
jgi:type IV secretory pathway TrbL component